MTRCRLRGRYLPAGAPERRPQIAAEETVDPDRPLTARGTNPLIALVSPVNTIAGGAIRQSPWHLHSLPVHSQTVSHGTGRTPLATMISLAGPTSQKHRGPIVESAELGIRSPPRRTGAPSCLAAARAIDSGQVSAWMDRPDVGGSSRVRLGAVTFVRSLTSTNSSRILSAQSRCRQTRPGRHCRTACNRIAEGGGGGGGGRPRSRQRPPNTRNGEFSAELHDNCVRLARGRHAMDLAVGNLSGEGNAPDAGIIHQLRHTVLTPKPCTRFITPAGQPGLQRRCHRALAC